MSTALGLCGSLRDASFNRKLLHEAGRLFGGLEEGNLRLPLFDEDLEEKDDLPDAVAALIDQVAMAPAVIIATPEYNKAPPGVLKNALDWISRAPDEVWKNKPVAIMSATAGRSGGERSQYALRLWMLPFHADVLYGPEVLVGRASEEFDENGRLTGPQAMKSLKTLMQHLRAKAGVSD